MEPVTSGPNGPNGIPSAEDALKPDPETAADFEVENNKFAFAPGQLLNFKSLGAFHALGGIDGLEKGLRTDRKAGLSVDEQHLDDTVTFEDATRARQNPKPAQRKPPRKLEMRLDHAKSPTEAPEQGDLDGSGHLNVSPYPLGYPSCAAYQDISTFGVYKRFGTLRNHVFLYRQKAASWILWLLGCWLLGCSLLGMLPQQELAKLEKDARDLERVDEAQSPTFDKFSWDRKTGRPVGRYRAYEIPSVLAKTHFVNALGDYCAKRNFIKEEYALQIGLHIDRTETCDVTIGSGKKVTTKGVAKSSYRFSNDTAEYPLIFHVLPSCIHNVILGKNFLKATNTFSNLANQARR